MDYRKIAPLAAALCALTCAAAVFDGTVVGDIASASYWTGLGYSGQPGASDTVQINVRATSPTFTASADMSILDITFKVSGSYIDLSANSPTIRINQASNGRGMEFEARSAGYLVRGGTWYFVNNAHLFCGRCSTSSQDRHTITFDNTVITNVGRFYGSYYDRGTTVEMNNGTKVYASNFYGAYGKYASNSTFTVKGGSKLVSIDRMVYDQFSETFVPGVSEGGNNRLTVTGSGSLLKLGGSSLFGIAVPSNTLTVTAGATLETGSLTVGRGASIGNVILVEGSGTTANIGAITFGETAGCGESRLEFRNGANIYNTGSFTIGSAAASNTMVVASATTSSGDILLGGDAGSCGNSLEVSGSSDVTLRSGKSIVVGGAGACNRFDFTGGTVRFTGDGHVTVGRDATASNNVFRVVGASAVIADSASTKDLFGEGAGNAVLIEDGAVVGGFQLNAATMSSNCLIRVKNARFGKEGMVRHGSIGLGDDTTKSHGNRMEVVDGAEAYFLSFSISSFDNGLLVSNATFSADDSTRGIRVGYTTGGSTSSNCMVTIAGASTRVVTTGTASFNNYSTLRFIVPENGWTTAPLAADKFSMSKNSRILVDCAAFAERHGGNQTLISAESDLGEHINTLVAAASDSMQAGCKLYVAGNNLVLRTPRLGFSVIVR